VDKGQNRPFATIRSMIFDVTPEHFHTIAISGGDPGSQFAGDTMRSSKIT
jgi:hypothetical protein